MKFLRFKTKINKDIKTGYLKNNKVFELKKDILEYCEFNDVEKDVINTFDAEDVKVINPVNPSKIVCVGLNYKDHAKELNMELPDTPKLFIKPSTSVIGTDDNIIKPNMSNEIDYEGELAIVIGKKCKNVEVDESKDYIFGYTILNDVTARDVQKYDEQWTRGKSFDTFAPIGPVIETDLDPQNQKIKTTILKEKTEKQFEYESDEITDESKNKKLIKEIRQDSNTSNMVFNSFELVSFISKVMTLNPGDVIATGTPPGVGQVKVGEIVEVGIEDIGTLSNKLIK